MKTSPLIVATLLLPVAALAASPFDGTWKYNPASRFGNKWKPYVYIVDSNSYTCSSCGPAYTVKPDGSDQKVTGHDYDTSAVTLTATSATIVTKLKGKTLTSEKYMDIEQAG
jgi:hypothetical protein